MQPSDDIMKFIRRVVLSDETDPVLKSDGLDLLLRHNETHRILLENGSFIYMTDKDFREVQDKLDNEGRIAAIKEFRGITGFGLRISKQAVEDERNFPQRSY